YLDLRPDDPCRESARQIRKAGERAALLTQQLLAFSRRQVMAPIVLDLNTCVREVEKILRRVIAEDVELRTDLEAYLGRVMGDPTQVEQVVLNLAINARDAMPEGGQLVLQTRNVMLEASQTNGNGAIPAGQYVLLAVQDTGKGMDEDTLGHIFEPFFTTKE